MLKRCSPAIAFFAIVFIFLFSNQSCKKQNLQDSTQAPSDKIAMLHQAVSNSFDIDPARVFYSAGSKEFIVDGDGIISLEDAMMRFSGGPGTASEVNETNQRKYSYLVSSSKVNFIKIYADATVPQSWIAALDLAIINWNSAGSKVFMVRVLTSLGASSIITTYNNKTTSTVAIASFPNYFGAPGRSVSINTYYNGLTTGKKIYAMTHELGHIIGLCHTDEAAGSLITGTPKSDNASVMNVFCNSWAGFSSYDLMAVRKLYPKL